MGSSRNTTSPSLPVMSALLEVPLAVAIAAVAVTPGEVFGFGIDLAKIPAPFPGVGTLVGQVHQIVPVVV